MAHLIVSASPGLLVSGVATGGQRGQSILLSAKNLPKFGKKREKNREKEEKSGRTGKDQESCFVFVFVCLFVCFFCFVFFFILPLPTGRASYATVVSIAILRL